MKSRLYNVGGRLFKVISAYDTSSKCGIYINIICCLLRTLYFVTGT